MSHQHKMGRLIVIFSLIGIGTVLWSGGGDGEKLKQARKLLYDRAYEQALGIFEEVLKGDPNELEAALGKMDALAGLRKLEEINRYADTQVKDKAGSAEGFIISANNAIWRRQFDQAEAQLKQAVEKKTDAYLAHYLLGFVKKITRRPEEAITHLNAAIAANPDFAESYYLLGDLYFAKGESEKVFQNWRAYLEKVPRGGSRYEYVSKTLQSLGSQ